MKLFKWKKNSEKQAAKKAATLATPSPFPPQPIHDPLPSRPPHNALHFFENDTPFCESPPSSESQNLAGLGAPAFAAAIPRPFRRQQSKNPHEGPTIRLISKQPSMGSLNLRDVRPLPPIPTTPVPAVLPLPATTPMPSPVPTPVPTPRIPEQATISSTTNSYYTARTHCSSSFDESGSSAAFSPPSVYSLGFTSEGETSTPATSEAGHMGANRPESEHEDEDEAKPKVEGKKPEVVVLEDVSDYEFKLRMEPDADAGPLPPTNASYMQDYSRVSLEK